MLAAARRVADVEIMDVSWAVSSERSLGAGTASTAGPRSTDSGSDGSCRWSDRCWPVRRNGSSPARHFEKDFPCYRWRPAWSSWIRASEIPKWCAISWYTVSATCFASASRVGLARTSGPRKIVILLGVGAPSADR